MSSTLQISFQDSYSLDSPFVNLLKGNTGLYFIFLANERIFYPLQRSRLIYIGMSESVQNSIGNRLAAHRAGKSGNLSIKNYADHFETLFTYLTFDLLKIFKEAKVSDLERSFITNFARIHGAHPICNNQANFADQPDILGKFEASIGWKFFW